MYKGKAKKKKLLHFFSSGCRSSTVLPLMEGLNFNLYNGRKTKPVSIVLPMFGSKLGSLVSNKEICVFKKKQTNQKGKVKGNVTVTKKKKDKFYKTPRIRKLEKLQRQQHFNNNLARATQTRRSLRHRGSKKFSGLITGANN